MRDLSRGLLVKRDSLLAPGCNFVSSMLYEEGVATCSFLQFSVSGLSLIRAVAIEEERDVSDLFQRIAKTQGCFPRSRALHGEYLFTRKAAIEGRSWRS